MFQIEMTVKQPETSKIDIVKLEYFFEIFRDVPNRLLADCNLPNVFNYLLRTE